MEPLHPRDRPMGGPLHGRHDIEVTALRVTYWPDRDQRDLYAEVVLQEVR